MYDFKIATAALRPGSTLATWQPSALDSRRNRMVGNCMPDSRLVSVHHNSTVPTKGAVSVTAGARGAAKQAAPPRGVPR